VRISTHLNYCVVGGDYLIIRFSTIESIKFEHQQSGVDGENHRYTVTVFKISGTNHSFDTDEESYERLNSTYKQYLSRL
jgi:hypothetical protein